MCAVDVQVSCSTSGQKNPNVVNAKLGDYWLNAYWAAVTDLALAYYYTGVCVRSLCIGVSPRTF